MENPWWQSLGIARLNQPAMMSAEQQAAAPVTNPDQETQYNIDSSIYDNQRREYDNWVANLGNSQLKYERGGNMWNNLEQQRLNNTGYGSNRFYNNGEIYNYDPNSQTYRGNISGSTFQQPAEEWTPEMAAAPPTPTNTYVPPTEPLPPAQPSTLPPNNPYVEEPPPAGVPPVIDVPPMPNEGTAPINPPAPTPPVNPGSYEDFMANDPYYQELIANAEAAAAESAAPAETGPDLYNRGIHPGGVPMDAYDRGWSKIGDGDPWHWDAKNFKWEPGFIPRQHHGGGSR